MHSITWAIPLKAAVPEANWSFRKCLFHTLTYHHLHENPLVATHDVDPIGAQLSTHNTPILPWVHKETHTVTATHNALVDRLYFDVSLPSPLMMVLRRVRERRSTAKCRMMDWMGAGRLNTLPQERAGRCVWSVCGERWVEVGCVCVCVCKMKTSTTS